jgi:polysaccharide export outer membrane protein
VLRHLFLITAVFGLSVLSACTHMIPMAGPTARQVEAQQGGAQASPAQIVEIDAGIAQRLALERRQSLFSETLGQEPARPLIGSGDVLEISLWEAPPATLFGGGGADPRAPAGARAVSLPEQAVDRDGFVSFPFAGRIQARGRSPQDVEAEIVRRLSGKANQPEVMVRVVRPSSAMVTVVGEVVNSTRVPLTASGERLLDALAAAGGVRQPVSKTMLQVTRGQQLQRLPLDLVIQDPSQNVPLHPGDVVTALFQTGSFTALGATGRNEEIAFEANGISLAQALARAGGVLDNRGDARGLFLFRFEREGALDWPRKPVETTPDGRVPVIYRLDLGDPSSFFVMQRFPMRDRDVLYVSNAPAADLQKFLNLVFSVVYPITTIQANQ